MTTQILEDYGMVAYYYTGDIGSAPNRTFYEGKMVSEKVIAFPVMPFGKSASLWEMKDRDYKTEEEVLKWLYSIADYTEKNKTIRLMYSHPVDIEHFPNAVLSFINKIKNMKNNGKIYLESMTTFTEFFLRFLDTKYSFSIDNDEMIVTLKNEDTLKDITIAIPKNKYAKIENDVDIDSSEDDKYYYLVIKTNVKEKIVILNKNK